MQLQIDTNHNRVIITEFSKAMCVGTVNNAFGNIMRDLENAFKSDDYFSAEFVSTDMFSRQEEVCGFKTKGTVLTNIYGELGKRSDEYILNKDDLIKAMSQNNIKLPLDDFRECVMFNVKSLLDVLLSLLYFYSLHGLKLRRCKHCGLFFAAQTLKTQYCNRKSPLQGYTNNECRTAVNIARCDLARRKKRIDNRIRISVNGQLTAFEYINEYRLLYSPLEEAQREHPTPENLKACLDFLIDVNDRSEWLNYKRKGSGKL